MIVRRLNNNGIVLFEEFLNSLLTDSPQDIPTYILNDPATSEFIGENIEVELKPYNNRYEAAKYLYDRFSQSGLVKLERDKGLWTWLSLFLFDQLCPPDKQGIRKPGERARWIPVPENYRKYYRHLLAGPYLVYRAYRDNPQSAMALLCGPLHTPGDVVEQLASRIELVTNKGLMEVATSFYVDSGTNKYKRGAGSKGSGSPRRLAEVINQFDVTWDLYSMASSELARMLPKEFDKFRGTSSIQKHQMGECNGNS